MLRKKLVSLFIISSFFSINFINQTAQADIPFVGDAMRFFNGNRGNNSNNNTQPPSAVRFHNETHASNPDMSPDIPEKATAEIDAVQAKIRANPSDSAGWNEYNRIQRQYGLTVIPQPAEYRTNSSSASTAGGSNSNNNNNTQPPPQGTAATTNNPGSGVGPKKEEEYVPTEEERRNAELQEGLAEEITQSIIAWRKAHPGQEPSTSPELQRTVMGINDKYYKQMDMTHNEAPDTVQNNEEFAKARIAAEDEFAKARIATEGSPQSPLTQAADKAAARIVADETPASIAAATQASGLPAGRDAPDGIRRNPDGTVIYDEGRDVPDGIRRNPDGTVIYDEGRDVPDGIRRDSNGVPYKPEDIDTPDEVKRDSNGVPYKPEDLDAPDGVKRNSDGTVYNKDDYDAPDGVKRNSDGTVYNKDDYDAPDGVKRNSDGTVYNKDDYDTPDGVKRNSDGTVKYDTANKPGSDNGSSGKGRVVDGDWFPGSLNGSKGAASSASGGVAKASKGAMGSSGEAAGSLGGSSFGSAAEVADALSDPNLSVGDAAKFGLSQYNLIDPNPSKMTFRNLEMAKYLPGLIQGAMSGNLKGAVGGAVGGMAGGLVGDSLGNGYIAQLAEGGVTGGVSSGISGGNPLNGAVNGVKGAGLGIVKGELLGAMNNVIPSPNIATGLRNVVDSTNCFTTSGCIRSPREFANNMQHNTLNSLSNGGYGDGLARGYKPPLGSGTANPDYDVPSGIDYDEVERRSNQSISDTKTIQDAKALSNAKNVNRPVYLPNSQQEKDLQAALARTGQEYPTVRDDYARQNPNKNQPSPAQPSGFTGRSVQAPGLEELRQQTIRDSRGQNPAQPSTPETMQRVREQNRIQNPFGNQTNSNQPRTLNHSPDNIQYRNSVGITPAPNNRATEFTGDEVTGTPMAPR